MWRMATNAGRLPSRYVDSQYRAPYVAPHELENVWAISRRIATSIDYLRLIVNAIRVNSSRTALSERRIRPRLAASYGPGYGLSVTTLFKSAHTLFNWEKLTVPMSMSQCFRPSSIERIAFESSRSARVNDFISADVSLSDPHA